MKTAVTASRLGVPVMYGGVKYERISARITRLTPEGEKYSLELADYCGSAVVIAPVEAVELTESAKERIDEWQILTSTK